MSHSHSSSSHSSFSGSSHSHSYSSRSTTRYSGGSWHPSGPAYHYHSYSGPVIVHQHFYSSWGWPHYHHYWGQSNTIVVAGGGQSYSQPTNGISLFGVFLIFALALAAVIGIIYAVRHTSDCEFFDDGVDDIVVIEDEVTVVEVWD